MNTPVVSVIMPVYNAGAYLKEAIESILNQTLRDLELIIVNDASTDNSREIALSFNDPRITIVNNERNSGSAFSMNKGMALARGEFVARMDADDISLPQRLEKQVVFMQAHSSVGIVGSWVKVIGDTHEYIWNYESDSEELKARTLFDCRLAFPAVMMRRKMCVDNNISFNPQLRRAEDYDVWARAVDHFAIANIPEVLLNYRLHPNQTSHKFDGNHDEALKSIHRFELKRVGINTTDEELRIHRLIAHWSGAVGADDVRAADAWLVKIVTANNNSSYYKPTALKKVVAHLWQGLLQRAVGNKNVWVQFASARTSTYLSVAQKIRFTAYYIRHRV